MAIDLNYTVPVVVTLEDDGTISRVSIIDEEVIRDEPPLPRDSEQRDEYVRMQAAYEKADQADWPEWMFGY